jgi:hypothetical protein
MSNLSNATLNTLQGTYFDDYNEDKQYYRILFRPAVAVQARELTQLQTMIQTQISRFGDNIFKDGSIVSGCAPLYLANTDFVRVVDSFLSNTSNFATVRDLTSNYIITNSTNTALAVRASIYQGVTGFQSNYPDTNVIYVRYFFTGKDGANNDVQKFANGDTLYIYSANQDAIGTLSNTNIITSINVFTTNATANAATGQGFLVSVTDGVIYQKGFFQKVNKQVVVVNAYSSNAANLRVGFETVESIITEYQDQTLNDNANGSTNYNAPGSHRLKLTPALVVKDPADTTTKKNFFPIVEFDNSNPVVSFGDPVYAALGDRIAKEKYEAEGDYNVIPHSVETKAHPSNTHLFNYAASPGISYIKGYRVELIGERTVSSNRSETTNIAKNRIITTNYGPYVYCNCLLGAMAFDKLGEVALYDAAFTAITDREGLSGGTSGNISGYANIKSVVYYSGIKGTSDCQYYVYLSNIRMLPGKSFDNDVKSMYYATGTYTKFKADLVLESSKAVLYDNTLTPLIYNTGYKAVKSLTPTGGARNTTFYYRKTTSSTLNTNGFMSFTLSGGLGAAGAEQLYDTDSRDYQIVLGANGYSANLAGTITANVSLANATSANIVGSSTTFEAQLKVGDTIRLSNTGGSAATFKVTNIYSNTLMTVTPNVTVNAVSNTYQRYYQDGHIFNVTDSMLSVNAISNTFTINTGVTFDSGSGMTVYAQYPVAKSPAVQAAKTVNKNVLIKIDCSNNAATSVGPWNLGFPDIIDINAIYVGTSYANTTSDRQAWFSLDNGQRDDSYDLATLSVLPAYKSQITGSTKILIDVNVLVANTNSGIGYFSVDSYPLSTDGITSNSTTITIADIPLYVSKTANAQFDLRNSIDFRPVKVATANIVNTTDPANNSITINPAAANANTWSISSYGQYLPEVDSQFIADYEYYLSRRDLLLLGKTGQFTVSEGVPEVNPKKPLNISEAAVLAETYVPPYPSLSMKEAEVASRPDMATKIILTSNRRYTMRDIGSLENRINRLEYYTVLSTLEKQAKDLAIPSATGQDRFKNGIFADPFNSHALGNIGSAEYQIAIDPSNSVARPFYKNHYIDFQYNSDLTSVVVRNGPFVTLPYTYEKFATNPYATKYRACTEKYWTWNGSLLIAPQVDIFTDETQLPAINTTIDLASPLNDLMGAGAINAQIYGKQSTVASSTASSSSQVVNGGTNINTTTTTTTTTSQDITKISITPVATQKTLTNAVVSVAELDYIRSQDVAFYAKNLKPNTKLHMFIDSVNVDAYVAPGVLLTETKNFAYDKKANQIVSTTAPKGTTLVANSSGCIAGIVTIPPKTFRAGDRTIMICDVDNLVTGKDAILTKSQAIYHASGLAVTKQASTLTTINPGIFVSQGKIVNTVVSKSSHVDFVPDPVADRTTDAGDHGGDKGDPIAQSFMVTVPNDSAGHFIASLDLYFKSKSNNKGITVFLVPLNAGVPDFSQILGKATLLASEVSVSDNAQTATNFRFDHPIYVAAGTDYAFCIEPDAHSPDYLIWTSEVGGFDVGPGNAQVYKNPYDGVMFVSANRNSWTPYQTEDIKFNLYRARFTSGSGSLYVNNEKDEYLTLTGVTKANTRSISVGDVVYTTNTSYIANTSGSAPFGIVQFYDETNGIMILDSSTVGGFSNVAGSNMIQVHRMTPYSNTSITTGNTASSNLLTSSIIAYANIASVDNYKYHTITPKFATLSPQNTKLEFSYKGTDTSYNADTSYKSLANEGMNEQYDKERIVMSRSNEVSYLGSASSAYIKIDFTSSDSLVSPVIDLRRKSSYFIENKINNDLTNENYTYGNALSKYISKKVILADGQDAEDLHVTLTAFRPINSNIAVYAKIANGNDSEDFDTKTWTLLSYQNGGGALYSTQNKTDDFIEYDFGFPVGTVVSQSFNANTGVNSTADFISFTSNAFTNNQVVLYYTAVGNTIITGLANNTNYFVVNATSTSLQLSAAQGGSPVAINATAITESGHYIKGYNAPFPHTAYLNPDSTPVGNIVEYYNNNNSRMQNFKYFAIKVVLLSTDRVNYPRLNDIRAIALQK